ncbi:hypothetical protein EKH57_17925 (plasmid) [Halorubrum sp. BOL3-1]|uniref:hypothetical protein n=1 Tax=Halorubrum sp. BOL3-1 TaxID=2497325 RepID=UPI001004E2A4|nr:hypothetical protein [Halorubrum sp. BOL3-1]QAU14551.1 hypothetical protein EKH57_17925 [Halorubrum sp. BOL3-1]
MGFGSGSGDDPFEDEESDDNPQTEAAEQPPEQERPTTSPEETTADGQNTSRGQTAVDDQQTTQPRGASETRAFNEIDVTDDYSTAELARMLMAQAYREEDPRVPYATWRSGTSTGRDRTTIELSSEVDDLVKAAMREFEAQYDAEINKADLREFALVWGLLHTEELFEMAEEWGLQFN